MQQRTLKKMKERVTALWIAIGGKSVTSRFALKAIENIGYTCPKMSYPLRNPLQIAKHSHQVSQDAAKNMREMCLQNPIVIQPETNIIEGKLIEIDVIHTSCLDSLKAAIAEIQSGYISQMKS